ncbi:MAG: hypothetical protein IH884_12925, partial [Myxococcales bacterium]|nr:hypothetical protein [Myxococcales bacterium]
MPTVPLDGIRVSPNPVQEGQEVTVEAQGDTLFYSVDGGPWQEMPLDDEGRGSIEAPIGSSVIAFSDRGDPPIEAGVEVNSSGLNP